MTENDKIICSVGPPCAYWNYGDCHYIRHCQYQRPLRIDNIYIRYPVSEQELKP